MCAKLLFLKSGTAPGALIREAEHAQSKLDFISKLSIALKEANECEYWVQLLKDGAYIDDKESKMLVSANRDLRRFAFSKMQLDAKEMIERLKE